MLKRFWNDQNGAVVSSELALVGTVVVIGMVTGLANLRDTVTSELADTAQAIGGINQSYQVQGISSPSASVGSSQFVDQSEVQNGNNQHRVGDGRVEPIGGL